MAVIYSKLGGCLGVTTKLGPLARTDLCAGVKGWLGRLMTHLGLGSSGEWVVRLLPWVPVLSAWEAVLFLWEAQRARCLPDLLPWSLIAWLTCLGRITSLVGEGSHWTASFLWRRSSYWPACHLGGLGWTASFPRGKVNTCLGNNCLTSCLRYTASFSKGKESTCLRWVASFPKGKESTWLTACLR